jgi:hypothetical protein
MALGVDPWLLDSVIRFESGGNPRAVSPDGQAFGLIQFRGQSIHDLGYQSGHQLIDTLHTYDDQMYKAVFPYLKKYYPFSTVQSFLMSIFYPKYRNLPEFWPFPSIVRHKNIDISIPLDYINRVYRIGKRFYLPRFLIYGVGGLWILSTILQEKRAESPKRA